MHVFRRRSGFTLIELSIVLVIVGLIAGGVMVGRSLIESARLRKIISAHEDFIVRWNSFKMKYNCLPGDCLHATGFFGDACPSMNTTASCNGDGDKWVSWNTTPRESNLVMNHLYHAGLSKNYNFHNGNIITTSTNTPYILAPNNNATTIWLLGSTGSNWAQMYAAAADDNVGSNLKGIGVQTTRMNSVGSQPRVAIETVSVVRDLDVKMDDGIPAAGKFRASGGYDYGTSNQLTCITGSGMSSAYDLTQTEKTCRYVYSIQ